MFVELSSSFQIARENTTEVNLGDDGLSDLFIHPNLIFWQKDLEEYFCTENDNLDLEIWTFRDN